MKKLLYAISLSFVIILLPYCISGQTSGGDGCLSTDYDFDYFHNDIDNHNQIYDSRNGSWLSPHDTIKMLVIFIELEYSNPSLDPSLEWSNSNYWTQGNLPIWADTLFSPNNPVGLSQKTITQYFQLASSNDHIVLGDYLRAPTNNGVFHISTDN